MRRGFANATSSRWNAFVSEVTSFWPSTFSKEKLTLTRLISSSAHHEPVYEGTHTDYCRYQAIFDSAAVPSPFGLRNSGTCPAHIVLSPSLFIFRKQLDRHWFKILPAAPFGTVTPGCLFFSLYLESPSRLCSYFWPSKPLAIAFCCLTQLDRALTLKSSERFSFGSVVE